MDDTTEIILKRLQNVPSMGVVLVNHPLVSLRNDVLGSGIPYVPVSLAYLAAFLRDQKHPVTVIDGFGEAPLQKRQTPTHLIQGLTPEQIAAKIPADADLIMLYAGNVVAHEELLTILRHLRSTMQKPIVIFENTQAVTAYSLSVVADQFFDAGATAVLTGESEIRINALLDALKSKDFSKVDALVYRKDGTTIRNPKVLYNENLDALPFPAWDLLPLANYWKLGYSHGPRSDSKYLPILTSRGCPFGCTFCVVPATNQRRWKARSAKNVADEMAFFHQTLGVREFHLEDLNPTVRKERMVELSKEIMERKLPVKWKISAGTKIETLDKETITAMALGGLAYLSFSPESGSPRVLKLMDKPFNHALALDLAKHLHANNVRTQACFVLGFPGETDDDLKLTREYVLKLAKAGVDEVALFIMTPMPGSVAGPQVTGYSSLSQLTFSPSWRADFAKLQRFRVNLYLQFYATKLLHHPIITAAQPFHVLARRFSTKTEMAVWRYFQAHVRGSS
jgi:anaerobic magnesium-protoporphyrin IX monomethyl ester cyclase